MIQVALPSIVAELTTQFIYGQLFLIIPTFTFFIYYSMTMFEKRICLKPDSLLEVSKPNFEQNGWCLELIVINMADQIGRDVYGMCMRRVVFIRIIFIS